MTEFTVVLHGLNIGESSKPRRRERERRRPAEVLPANLPPLGLTLEEVAAFIGVSPNKYARACAARANAAPRIIDGRRVHDRELAHAAFKRLPTRRTAAETPMTGERLARQQLGRTSTMPRKLPPFVECWRDRHGKVRAYYRRDRGAAHPVAQHHRLAGVQRRLSGCARRSTVGHDGGAPCDRRSGHHRGAGAELYAESGVSRSASDHEDRLCLYGLKRSGRSTDTGSSRR